MGGLLSAAFFACGPRELPASHAHSAPPSEDASFVPADEPTSYMLAPWGGQTTDQVPLGKSDMGLLVEGVRIVASGRNMRAASEVAGSHLTHAEPVPARFGGGFLFYNDTSIYWSDRFDGSLKAVAYFPEARLSGVAFSFDRVLVRSSDGQRWMIKIPSGERVSIEPAGLVDLLAREDGLGLALTDTGRLLSSHDAGKSWRDVTSQLKGAPSTLTERDEGIYVTTQEGGAARLESGGRLARVEQVPEAPVKDRDSRWRSGEAPLRMAVRAGVPAEDEGTALVAVQGDLFRISLRTGEIVSVQTGKLPPDATCEAVRTSEDALFLCTRHGMTQERLVVSGTLFGKTPQVEQTFSGYAPFYVGDDGAIAYAGPCSGAPRDGVVCVRSSAGSWQERGGQSATSDSGVVGPLGYVVPRNDGTAVSLALEAKPPTLTDLATGDVRTFADTDFPSSGRRYGGGKYGGSTAIFRDWSFGSDGVLRGWSGARAIVIPPSGAPTSSAFVGDNASYGHSGVHGLGMTQEGRLFQTSDRGLTWTEVAVPPSQATAPGSKRSLGGMQCGVLGCSMGAWVRVGYRDEPARPRPRRVEVAPPSEIKTFAEGKLLACETTGPQRGKALPSGDREFGFGATFLPSGVEPAHYMRMSLHPVNGGEGGDGDESAKRAMSLPATTGFRHAFSYVAPFDPTGTIRSGTIVSADIAAAARGSNVSVDDLVADFSLARVVPVTPVDPAAPDNVLFSNDRLFIELRAGGTRAGLMPEDASLTPISAVETSADDLVVLASNGSMNAVYKLARGGGLTTVFEWRGGEDSERYPANPDAVGIGPHGEIGVIRMPSGSEPASAGDPARLLLPKGKESKLAPWSTLTLADSPECKADPAGFRATVQVMADWVRIEPSQERSETSSPVMARVRWSETRVCLEGLEVRRKGVDGDRKEPGRHFEQWTVLRVLPQLQSSRIAVGSGFDLKQPEKCVVTNK
jgi:hypothetical protein